LAVTRDTSHNQYVLAAVTGTDTTAGMWRMTNGQSSSWTQVDSTIGTASQNSAHMPFAVLPGSPYVYVLDRGAGLFRGANYGQSWTRILSFNTKSDTRTGFLALNPAVADELWLAKTDGLFKISGASTFNNGTPTSVPLPGGVLPGAVAIAPDGTVYCIGLGAAAPSSPDTVLLRSVDRGNSWQDVSGPGPGIAANVSRPQDMAIASDGRIYISNDANIVAQGYPAAGWTVQGGDLHLGADEHTGAATQMVASTAPVTATGQITSGTWLMVIVALKT
jgi:hypothetical protein